MSDVSRQQEIVERLQTKWLERMEQLLDSKEMSSTDAATLYRFLSDNGWTLDPSKLPQGLKDRLSGTIAFDEEDEFGPRVKR